MISFLTSAKSFDGPCRDMQIRAIESWLSVGSDVEVILYGESEGAAGVCQSLGARYVPDVETSPSGIPLFTAIARHAKDHAKYDIQCYVNCDILLSRSLAIAVGAISFDRFLMVGQRVDLAEGALVDVRRDDWLKTLKTLAEDGKASLHRPSGKDYFVFTRGLWDDLDQLVIGRAGYDDALLAFCLRRDIPIIDATFQVAALHQCHDYGHVPGKRQEVWRGPDVRLNERLHRGITHSAPEVSDAQWTLRKGELIRTEARGDKIRQKELYLRFTRDQELPGYILRALWRALRSLRVYSPPVVTLSQVLEEYASNSLIVETT